MEEISCATDTTPVATDPNKRRGKEPATTEAKRSKTTAIEAMDEDGSSDAEPASIQRLPVELLASIVHQFDIRQWKQLELVSKQFRRAVLAAWRDLRSVNASTVFGIRHRTPLGGLNAFPKPEEKMGQFLETLVVRSPFIEELTGLSTFKDRLSSDEAVLAIASSSSRLRVLDLGRSVASPASLIALSNLNNLRELTVIGAFDDRSLIDVASAIGHSLIALKIPGSLRLSDHGLIEAAPYLQNLLRLDLGNTSISDVGLMAVAASCRELRSLSLRHCHQISSQGGQAVIDSCGKLEKLCFCESLVDLAELNDYHRIWCYFKLLSLCINRVLNSQALLNVTLNSHLRSFTLFPSTCLEF